MGGRVWGLAALPFILVGLTAVWAWRRVVRLAGKGVAMSDRAIVGLVSGIVCVALAIALFFIFGPDAGDTSGPSTAIVQEPESKAPASVARTPAPVDPEIARLRAENEALKKAQQEAERARRQEEEARKAEEARAAAEAAAKPGSIAGAAWVERGDGSSDLLRGMPVAVVKAHVSGKVVAEVLLKQVPEWRDLASRCRLMAAKSRSDAKQYAFGRKYLEEAAAEDEKQAAEYDRKADEIQRLASQMPDTMSTAKAFALTAEMSPSQLARLPEGTVEVVAETRTNVDGKWRIRDLPPGDYCVWAFQSSNTFWIEWMIHVTVKSDQELPLDLFNENALVIRNFK